jgi:hypothetical protein
MMPGPRLDPVFHPGDGTVVLRIRGDDKVETTIEWGWEKVLDLGSSLIEHGLAAKRHAGLEAEQGTDAPRRGYRERFRPSACGPPGTLSFAESE